MMDHHMAGGPGLNTDVFDGRLLVVVGAVFLGFLAIGTPLAALPLQIHQRLGYSSFAVGCAISAQSAATLLTRPIAGRLCDKTGARRTARLGLLSCILATVLYAASAQEAATPVSSLTLLLAGRLMLGLGESLLITGVLAWGIGLSGPTRAGKVMAWTGIAIYGALAIGAPGGLRLFKAHGFLAVAIAAMAFPLVGLLGSYGAPSTGTAASASVSLGDVVRAIWRPGIALALSTVAFGGLAAFLPLLYATRHWQGAELAFTAFGLAYVLVRLLFGGLPDRVGGRHVAVVSLLIEAVGQTLLWRADSSVMAALGAALTGCGCSLVLPALGILALAGAGTRPRGTTLGIYVGFFDLSLASIGPAVGLIVSHDDYSPVFLIGALAATLALILAAVPARVLPSPVHLPNS
jgi:MFS family permease